MANSAHQLHQIWNQLRPMPLSRSGECFLETWKGRETRCWVGSTSPKGHSTCKEGRRKTDTDFACRPSLHAGEYIHLVAALIADKLCWHYNLPSSAFQRRLDYQLPNNILGVQCSVRTVGSSNLIVGSYQVLSTSSAWPDRPFHEAKLIKPLCNTDSFYQFCSSRES